MDNLFDNVKKLDAKIEMEVDGLFSKVSGYFRNSIDSTLAAEKTSRTCAITRIEVYVR